MGNYGFSFNFIYLKVLYFIISVIPYLTGRRHADSGFWHCTAQVHPIEDQTWSTAFNATDTGQAQEVELTVCGMWRQVKVAHRIAIVLHVFGLWLPTGHIIRQVTAKIFGVEEKVTGAPVQPEVPLHANDELLAVVGMKGDVGARGIAVVGQFWVRGLKGWTRKCLMDSFSCQAAHSQLTAITQLLLAGRSQRL